MEKNNNKHVPNSAKWGGIGTFNAILNRRNFYFGCN